MNNIVCEHNRRNMNSNWTYYLFLVLGFMAIWLAMRTLRKESSTQESFEGLDGDALPNPNGEDPVQDVNADVDADAPKEYIEDISKLPKTDIMKFYLTSFSDKALTDRAPYSPEDFKWYDFKEEDVSFRMVGDIPKSIRSLEATPGLDLKKLKLVGPASHTSCGRVSSVELGSFTIFVYGKLNSLVFDTERPKVVFQMFAENPNHIQWSFVDKDKANCYIEVILGNVNKVYRWSIPKSTLLSNGNITLYALTFDLKEPVSKINVYVGMNSYSASTSSVGIVRLGNSPMEINSQVNWDFSMSAFGYFNGVLTPDDLAKWSEYFLKQSGGMAKNMKFIQDAYNLEVLTLNQQLSAQTNSVGALKEELEKCQAKLPALPTLEEKRLKWQIMYDGASSLSSDDMKKCSVLNLSSVWKQEKEKEKATATATASANVNGTPAPTTTPSGSGASAPAAETGLKINSPVKR